jgi:hypothetical protein
MKPAQKLMVIPMAVCDTVGFGLGICFTGLANTIGIPWAGYSWDDMHGFVIPYVLAAAIASLLSITAIACKNRRTSLSCYAATVNLALPLFCSYAFSRWPGGDDGGMMAWSIFVVPITVLILCSSIILVAIVMRTVPLNRYKAFWPWLIPYATLVVASIGSIAWTAKTLFSMFL